MQWKIPGQRQWKIYTQKMRVKMKMIQLSARLHQRKKSRSGIKQPNVLHKTPRITTKSSLRVELITPPSAGLLDAVRPMSSVVAPPGIFSKSIQALGTTWSQESDVLSTSALSAASDNAEIRCDIFERAFTPDQTNENITRNNNCEGSACPIVEGVTPYTFEKNGENTTSMKKMTTRDDQSPAKAVNPIESSNFNKTPTTGKTNRKAGSSNNLAGHAAPPSPDFTINLTEQKTQKDTDNKQAIKGTYVNGLFVPEESSLYPEIQEQMMLHQYHLALSYCNQASASGPQLALLPCCDGLSTLGMWVPNDHSPYWCALSQPLPSNLPNPAMQPLHTAPGSYLGTIPQDGYRNGLNM